jgi:hypothetical protein
MIGLFAALLLLPALVAGQTADPTGPQPLPYVEAHPVDAAPAPTPPPPAPAPEPATAPAATGPAAAPVEPVVAPPPPPSIEQAPANEPAPQAAANPTPTPTPAPAAAPANAEAPPTAPPPPASPTAEARNEFVKGELTHLGIDRLITKTTRILVSAGFNEIGQTDYLQVYPQFGLKLGDFTLGVGIPLNIEIFSSAYPQDPATPADNHIAQFTHAGTIRKEDWAEPGDFARVLTYLTYGKKEDHVYLDVGQQHASTLGHGAIMRRYNGNIDVDVYREGLQFDLYNDYAGAEVMVNDIVPGFLFNNTSGRGWDLIGALAFLKPLSLFTQNWVARSVSLGVTAVVDRSAPTSLTFVDEPPCTGPDAATACQPANVPAVSDKNRLITNSGPLVIGGVDLEMKVVKTENVDIKPYVDYSRFLVVPIDGAKVGGGFTAGVLGRFNFGAKPTHAFRVVAELRVLDAGYAPGYFDTFYEVDKFLMMGNGGVAPNSGQVPLTKLAATTGSSACATNPAFCGLPSRVGYYFEISYGIPEALGITLALQGDNSTSAKDLVAHLEFPFFSWLQLFGTLYVRGFDDISTVFKFDEQSVAFAGIRLKPVPILFISARAYKTFQLDAYKGANGPLGTLQYQNSVGVAADIGFGWDF